MFDARKFLCEKFATPNRLAAFILAFGYAPPKEETIYKWFHRESVPGEWFPVLLALLELEEGRPVSVSPYLRAAA